MNRFTISLDEQLARQFELLIADRRYGSRSEAVRDLIRHGLVRAGVQNADCERAPRHCIASVSFLHDPRDARLSQALSGLRHAHQDLVLSDQQTPLEPGLCLEVLNLRGPLAAVRRVLDQFAALAGVKHPTANVVPLDDPLATPHDAPLLRHGTGAAGRV